MFNINKISRLFLVVAFLCASFSLLTPLSANAQIKETITTNLGGSNKGYSVKTDGYGRNPTYYKDGKEISASTFNQAVGTIEVRATGRYAITKDGKTSYYGIQGNSMGDKTTFDNAEKVSRDQALAAGYDTLPAGSNTQASKVIITGCSGSFGLFSGLITAGQDIFKGLRDLIYVVAGFGIIGVAVGGFFGNLNWKWLGAIVIALIVIATTGELLAAITNCQSFTSTYIQDTLK